MELIIIIFALYGLFIVGLIFGAMQQKTFHPESKTPINTFTIVVAFRDEQENLPILLNSIDKQNYPKDLFEVILVDDHSQTPYKLPEYNFNIRLLQQTNEKASSPKKEAINTAIQHAKNDWIITTDADCEVSENWLKTLDNFIQETTKAKMICGMVFTKTNGTLLEDFQLLEFMSLQSTTMGSFGIEKPFMCNGANFAYRKDFFEQLEGFKGNENIASGDDVFLLQKALLKHSEEVYYLSSKEHAVLTKPVKTISDLINQKVRWASKTKYSKKLYPKFLGSIVMLGNLAWIIALFGLLYNPGFIFIILFKILIDFTLIYQTQKYAPNISIPSIFISSIMYPFYSVWIGILVIIGNGYSWKGRKYNSK